MIKASALYLSVIVSLVIVLICGAIVMASYLIGMQHASQKRAFRLRDNLESGIQLVLSSEFPSDSSFRMPLFEITADSVLLSRTSWGIYELGQVSAWINTDTLHKSFLIAVRPEDSLKVFFLADEDRPMSISGASMLKGTVYLPKAGIKAAYVNGTAYKEQKLVHGITRDSQRNLTEPVAAKLESLQKLLYNGQPAVKGMTFLHDSTVTIGADFKAENALIVGKYVRIEDDFSGQLQVIATDSIVVGNHVKLRYPSALVVIKNDTAAFQTQIRLGSDCELSGQLISWEKTRTEQMPLICIGERSVVKGEIWSKGYVSLARGSSVDGAVSAIRLMARIDGGLYENYLVDVKLNIAARSRYYLSPALINTKPGKTKILCWIN